MTHFPEYQIPGPPTKSINRFVFESTSSKFQGAVSLLIHGAGGGCKPLQLLRINAGWVGRIIFGMQYIIVGPSLPPGQEALGESWDLAFPSFTRFPLLKCCRLLSQSISPPLPHHTAFCRAQTQPGSKETPVHREKLLTSHCHGCHPTIPPQKFNAPS